MCKQIISSPEGLKQWFLTFLKLGNTFDYIKNLRNTEISDPKKKKTKTSRVEMNVYFRKYIIKYI